MIAIVRIRGTMNTRNTIETTLKLLHLDRANSCIVLPDTPMYRGMLMKVRDRTAYGTITYETFRKLLEKRARLEGNRRLTDATVKEIGYDSVDALAKAIFESKAKFHKLKKLVPVFHLTPAVHGLKDVKVHWPKGDLGDRGDRMDELIKSMM